MANVSILYLTDNDLDPKIRDVCIHYLHQAAGDTPIVSASQGPCSVGKNVNLGPIGRSGLNMYKQILAGLDLIDTKWVAIAEHDCIYDAEHFQFIPPDDQFFWYNLNVWFVQYDNPKYPEWNGMYSYKKNRRVQSQLICDVEKLRQVTYDQIKIVTEPQWSTVRYNKGVGEPGTIDLDKAMRLTRGIKRTNLREMIKQFLIGYQARDFKTKIPSIDIRHGSNFTGPRRGNYRRFELEPWGTLQDVMNVI